MKKKAYRKSILCASAFALLILLSKIAEQSFQSVSLYQTADTVINLFWYKMTKALGYPVMASAMIPLVMGILQQIRRKQLKKVDYELRVTGVLYAVTILVNAVFSFPVLLSVVIVGSVWILSDYYVRKQMIRQMVKGILAVLLFAVVSGQLLSGAWRLWEIAGAFFAGMALVYAYSGMLEE